MQLGGMQIDTGRIARTQRIAERDQARLDRREAGFELGRVAAGRLEQRLHPCTLVRSSCALEISLSAIASGLILKVPAAIASPTRATLSASKSLEAPPASRLEAVLERATVALASTVAALPACTAPPCAGLAAAVSAA